MTVKKHLALSQRIIIENGLREGKKINRIAREAKVSRSTVVRLLQADEFAIGRVSEMDTLEGRRGVNIRCGRVRKIQ